MSQVLNIVLPVFALIGLGWLVAATKILSRETGDGLAAFVFTIAVPALLVRTMATAPFSSEGAWGLYGSYFAGIAVAWILAALVITLVFRRGVRASVIAGVSAAFSNLVLMGIPLVQLAYGEAGLDILFLLIAVHLPVMVTIATFTMEYAVRVDGVEEKPIDLAGVAGRLALNFAKNPLIIGILAGLLWRFSGIPFAGLPAQIADLLGKAAGPVALFALGMSLTKYGIRGNVVPAFVLSALSLAIMPSVVYLAGTAIFALPPLWLKIAVLAACLPTGINAYLFATYFRIAEGLASNTMVIATGLSLLTIPFWLGVLSGF